MKVIASALVALSVLAGIAAPASAFDAKSFLPAAGTYTKLIGQTRSATAFAAALYPNGKQPEDFTCARA